MNLLEIHNLLINGHTFQIKTVNDLEKRCPYCGEPLVYYTVKDNKYFSEVSSKQGYLTYDGDTIETQRNMWSIADAEMLVGKCYSCNQNYSSLEAFIISAPIEGLEDFIVVSGEITENYEDASLYQILLGEHEVGNLVFLKNAEMNGIDGFSKDNTKRNLWLLEIGLNTLICCLESESGVMNGHYTDVNQANEWNMASFIVNSLFDYLCKIWSE